MSAATPGTLLALLAAIGLYGFAALQAALLWRRREALQFVYPAAIIAAAIALLADAVALAGNGGGLSLPLGLPQLGLRLEIDRLSAFFGIVVNGGVLAAALYGTGLDRDHDLSPRVEPFFALFAAAMNLVLLAGDAFSFLFAWELMSLASWALVVSRHDDPANLYAGRVYLIMALSGTMALLFCFGTLSGAAGGYAFADMRLVPPTGVLAGVALAMALLGAGSKAGIAPLHAWLPLAHPAAPSHVSALMSGVMTKVAIYALIRILFDLMGAPQWWWSLPFLILGAATAVLGLLYAVLDGDLKRVLAYSTVENIGIIFVGLGLALAFKASGLAAAAAVAVVAMLLHCLNHSWFKSLLFLGAGSVLHGTGRRDFASLGGLIHRMPVTAVFFLAGVLSISALPPFNGFVSEWLLFQAVLAGPAFPEPVLRFLSPAVGAMLALAAALAAACFVRAYGIAFLGRPRSDMAREARECPPPQQAAMALLAILCLFGGVFGSLLVKLLQPLVLFLAGSAVPGAGTGPTPFALVPFDALRSVYDAPLIAIFLLISGTLTTVLVHRLSSRRTRRSDPWDCGFPDASPITQYSASSFSQPLRRIYGASIFGARETVQMPVSGDTAPASLRVTLHDYVWDTLYAAPARAVLWVSERLNRIQLLTIRGYLMLVFAALIVLLLLAAVVLMREQIALLIGQSLQMFLVMLIAPAITGIVRRTKARFMRRRGAPIYQPYIDLLKLVRKEAIVAHGASWIFRTAPYAILAFTWVATALVPTFASGLMFNWAADAVALVALLGAARAILALAGMDVGTSFGGIGSSREMMIATLAEPAMLLVLLTLALTAGTTRLPEVALFFVSQPATVRVSLALALVALVIVALAENARIPVDNPATHLELTMVHEAMVLEYSGRHLAMIEAAAMLKLVLYISLIVCLFLPFGMAPADAGVLAWGEGLAIYLVKLSLGAALLGLWEVSIAKMRIFRVSEFLGGAFVFAFLAIILAFLTSEVLK